MKRDQEIERLVKYAQGMGVKVRFSKIREPENSADWSLDGQEITIYVNKNKTKTETILSLIHEIGHHLDHIHGNNRELDEKMDEAYTPDENGEIGKRKRKRILNSEIAGTVYWETIYKETDLKIAKYKLFAAMEYDIWQYEIYADTGKFPNRIARRQKHKELYAKHKKINYE